MTHKAAAISYLLVPHPNLRAAPIDCGYRQFTGEDCVLTCMRSLTDLAKEIFEWNQDNAKQPALMSRREREEHSQATHCYICQSRFDKDTIKICEHDHLTGKYLVSLSISIIQ